jgi:hypothetical protein
MPRRPGGSPAVRAIIGYAAQQDVTITARQIERWGQDGMAPKVTGDKIPSIDVMDHYVMLARLMPASGVRRYGTVISVAVQGFPVADYAIRNAARDMIGNDDLQPFAGSDPSSPEWQQVEATTGKWLRSDSPAFTAFRDGLKRQLSDNGEVWDEDRETGLSECVGYKAETVDTRFRGAIVSVVCGLRGGRLDEAATIADGFLGLFGSWTADHKEKVTRLLLSLDLSHSSLVRHIDECAIGEVVELARTHTRPIIYFVEWLRRWHTTAEMALVQLDCDAFLLALYCHMWGITSLGQFVETFALSG